MGIPAQVAHQLDRVPRRSLGFDSHAGLILPGDRVPWGGFRIVFSHRCSLLPAGIQTSLQISQFFISSSWVPWAATAPSSITRIRSASHDRRHPLGRSAWWCPSDRRQRPLTDLGVGGGIGAGGIVQDQHLRFQIARMHSRAFVRRNIDAPCQIHYPARQASLQEFIGAGRAAGGPGCSSVALGSPQRRFSRMVPENRVFFCNTTLTASRRCRHGVVRHRKPSAYRRVPSCLVQPGSGS